MTYYLCHTATGDLRHLASAAAPQRTLCRRAVATFDHNYQTGQPVVFADHWRNGRTTGADMLCSQCEALAPS
jgi:hypothetical protein